MSELAYDGGHLISDSCARAQPCPKSQNSDLNSTGFGIHAGVETPVWGNFSFGGELGYHDFGQSMNQATLVDGPTVTRNISDYTIDGLLTARYTWRSGINVFAKGGIAYATISILALLMLMATAIVKAARLIMVAVVDLGSQPK